jgi:predicted transglutaminase-like cysteine proteinase
MPVNIITGRLAIWPFVAAAVLQFSVHGAATELQPAHPQQVLRAEQLYAALPPPSVKRKSSREPFDEVAVPLASGDVPDKWRAVQTEIDAESAILDRCRAGQECTEAAHMFLDIVAQGQSQGVSHHGLARIGVINRAVNSAIVPMSDMKQWGVADHWSPPLETLTTRHGDCEDYAIAKYVALIDAGVAKEDVKLVIVRRRLPEEEHAVVAARVDGAWLILDNRTLALAPAAEVRAATPLFMLDDAGAKIFVPAIVAGGLS